MNDLLTNQKNAVDAIRPPSWADADTMATTAMRRVRRRRVVVRAAGATAAVLAVTGGIVLAQPQPELALPASASLVQPVSAEEADAPAGWSAYEYGGLTFAVPSDWTEHRMGGVNGEPGTLWADDAITEQFQLEISSEPGWTDLSEEVEEWTVPGAEHAEVGRYDDKIGVSANVEVERADGYFYRVRANAPSEDALDTILAGLKQTFEVSADAADIEEVLGRSDDLPVVELPDGLPGGWDLREVDGLEFGIPEGGKYEEGSDAAGETWRTWADDAGDREIWVTHWATGRDVLAARDAADGYRTFPLEGADYVDFNSFTKDEGGLRETVVVIRRADGGGTYQIRVVVPDAEGDELARQVAGSLALD